MVYVKVCHVNVNLDLYDADCYVVIVGITTMEFKTVKV